MNLFLLGPAFQAIYGGPMAYIHEKVMEKPARAGTFSFLLSLPLFLVAAAVIFLGLNEGFLAIGFVIQMALSPLIYALYDARKKSDSLSDTERMVASYERKLDQQAQEQQPEQTSVILNKRD